MRWQEIILQASEYLLTRCEWLLRRKEIRLKDPLTAMQQENFFNYNRNMKKKVSLIEDFSKSKR